MEKTREQFILNCLKQYMVVSTKETFTPEEITDFLKAASCTYDEAVQIEKSQKAFETSEAVHDYKVVKNTINTKETYLGTPLSYIASSETIGILADVTASKAIKVIEELFVGADKNVQYSLERIDN